MDPSIHRATTGPPSQKFERRVSVDAVDVHQDTFRSFDCAPGIGDLCESRGNAGLASLGCGCDVDIEALGADHCAVVVVKSFADDNHVAGFALVVMMR